MLIKAEAANYSAIEAAIKEKHPYDLPEIIALPVSQGDAAYLEWISAVSPALNGRPNL